VIFIPVAKGSYELVGPTEGEESGIGRSEWMGKYGGGRYNRRMSGYGRVIVRRVVGPFFF
jgi:hypothetical protein